MADTPPNDDQKDRLKQLEKLFWLADAPLFVDERLVGKFFDAVVRPKYEHVSETEERSKESENNLVAALGLKGVAGLHLPEWLKPIKLEVEATGNLTGEHKGSERTASISQLKPIWNAERQLEELARHYLAHHRDRIIAGDHPLDDPNWPKGEKWYSAKQDFFTRVPRAIAFIDLDIGTVIIPTAAEFKDGTTALLYQDLAARLTGEQGGPMREYPDGGSREEQNKYWASYLKYFKSKDAMLVIEEASKNHGRINWIDFRLLLEDSGQTLHLHVVPAGTADAGVFGYNFVRRTHKHGARIIGTLKSKPDMNVLAIYEK